MASCTGCTGNEPILPSNQEQEEPDTPDCPQPVAGGMGYTGHTDYFRNYPPTYVVFGDSDCIASVSATRQRVENLRALGIDAEFHL